MRKVKDKPLIYLFMALLALFFLAPFTWLILSSVDPKADIRFRIPSSITLNHYAKVLTGRTFTWIVNSSIISLASATLATLLSVLASYSLTRYKFKGREALVDFFVILRLMPVMVVVLPIMIIFARIGILDTLFSVILLETALELPFSVMIGSSYFETIPTDFEEAAMIDGCNRFLAFLRVTLPLSLPGLVTIWLLAFVTAWGDFLVPLFLLRTPDKFPVSVGIYMVFGEHGTVNYGLLSALSIIYSIPVLVVFLLMRKYLTKGIAGLAIR
ncbi:MAG: hypothetical protein B6U69_03935 [Thermofilum sp. ex4484_15]|nr:MAG: hypothetical protein B6U69_03935 [Thermofilum sp. ex4484_15]